MSIMTDFDINRDHADMQCRIGVKAPLVGNGSLYLTRGAASGAKMTCGYKPAVVPAQIKGRIRSLFKLDADVGLFGRNHFGFFFMTSQENVLTAGACYVLMIEQYNQLETLEIWKSATTGISGTWQTQYVLAVTAYTQICVEVEWQYDLTEWSGTKIVVRQGTSSDFSDLTDRIDWTDTTSPLAVSSSQGICYRLQSAGHYVGVFMDTTSMHSIT